MQLTRILSQMATEQTYKLIGGTLSPYTAKVCGYMNYKKIPHETVPASMEIYQGLIKPRVGWNVIPVLVTPENEVIQDTTDIINHLEHKFPNPTVLPASPKQKIVSLILELFSDEWMVMPIMHYRWSFPENLPFLTYEFGSMANPHGTNEQKTMIGEMVYGKFKGMCPNIGITEKSGPAIERSWEGLMDDLSKHLDQHNYLLGAKPCVADFALAGMIYAHLFRDPLPGYQLKLRRPDIAAWAEMIAGSRGFVNYTHKYSTVDGNLTCEVTPDDQLDFCANDEIPETLNPILSRFCSEFMPILLQTKDRVTEYTNSATPETTKLPRLLGKLRFSINGVEEERFVQPFNLWMWQHVLDAYDSLTASDQTTVAEWTSQFPHGRELVTSDLSSCRVERRKNILHLAESALNAKAKL